LGRMMIGDVEVLRVVEWAGPFASPSEVFPEIPVDAWQDNHDLLVPEHWDPAGDGWLATMQSWVLRSNGQTIVIDTGVGNAKQGVVPVLQHWNTGFLETLAYCGVEPGDVDVVINTHLHSDHVGWNTTFVDGHWTPTFPNATYLISDLDNAFAADDPLYVESVEPVLQAGLAQLWRDSLRIDGNLELVATPGHTPGSAVVRLQSQGQAAVFVGDVVHSPLQILHPHYNSAFCDDSASARQSRLAVLDRAAAVEEWVFPAYFGGTGAVQVHREGTGFGIKKWAEL
jgi:glyoxylase-like metal-dependent hydrolase (beta-lactamase superfamily II)